MTSLLVQSRCAEACQWTGFRQQHAKRSPKVHYSSSAGSRQVTCARRPTEWVSIFGLAATQWSSLNLARGRQPLYSTSFTGRTTVSKLTCLNLCEGGQHLSCHCGREKRGDYRGFWLPARVRKWTRLHKPPTLGSSQWFTPSTRNDGVPLDHRLKRIALFRPLAGSAPQSVRRQIGSPRLASQLLSAWLTTMKSMIGTGVFVRVDAQPHPLFCVSP